MYNYTILYEAMQDVRADHIVNLATGDILKTTGSESMNADEFYGEYLKAEDVKQNISVTIESVNLEIFDSDKKVVVSLLGFTKRFVLNKTNKDRLKELYGTAETDEWKNKQFTLGKEMVQYKGDEVPALRVKRQEEGA